MASMFECPVCSTAFTLVPKAQDFKCFKCHARLCLNDNGELAIVVPSSNVHDSVRSPGHYTFGKYEVLDVIEDWKLDHHRACAVKYIARAGRKESSTEIEDLRKAVVYLQRKINLLESGNGRQ